MKKYQQLVYDEAKRQGLTAAQLRVMTYPQVAILAGVKIVDVLTLKNISTPDFFYENVRRFVANLIEQEAADAAVEAKRAAFESAIKALPGFDKARVAVDDEGNLKIDTSAIRASEIS